MAHAAGVTEDDSRRHAPTRLVISPRLSVRQAGPEDLEISVEGRGLRMSPAAYVILDVFVHPCTTGEAFARIATDASFEDFSALISRWQHLGLLVPEQAAAEEPSLLEVVSPRILQQDAQDAMRRVLRSGSPCVIRDAFVSHFAKEMAAHLSSLSTWPVHENYAGPFFAYRHHNLYDSATFGEPLRRCMRAFDHRKTKAFVGDLTGMDCEGALQMSASLYLPGDYSLPHSDGDRMRSVAFVWHLSEHWEAGWGGHFYWCNPPTNIAPTFNTLILFNVLPTSLHFVCPVSPHARGRRLAINGWWTQKIPLPPGQIPETDWYFGGVYEVAPGVYTLMPK